MKSLVLLSGGLNSLVALMQQIDAKQEAKTATFSYAAKNDEQAGRAARQIVKELGVATVKITLPFVSEFFQSPHLKNKEPVQHGHYEDPNVVLQAVPYRMGIMIASAVGLAVSEGLESVVLGGHYIPHARRPMWSDNFYRLHAQAAMMGTGGKVQLARPFDHFGKHEVVKLGSVLGAPFELTYDCYVGQPEHCGQCGACIERMEAFEMAGVPDPTSYADINLYEQLKEDGRIGIAPKREQISTCPSPIV
jgi:7-cyano-7-deazaguanine synthase